MDKVRKILGKTLLQVDLLLLLSGVLCNFEERYSIVTVMSLAFSCGRCNSKRSSFRLVLIYVSEIDNNVGAAACLLGPLSIKHVVRLGCGSYPRMDH